MAGGKYDKLAGKTRPGTYINFESDRNDTVGNSERGIVLLPLIGYDFGPAKTPITLTAAAPDAYSVELGRSVYDATNDKMRLIREAFKKASKVIVYITESGTAATRNRYSADRNGQVRRHSRQRYSRLCRHKPRRRL